MDYDTSLITGAQIVDHTGVQDLANLVTDAELVLNTFALNAHRAIWRKLKARGIDPTALSNESLLKDAVAYEAVGRLALAGYLPNVSGSEVLALSAAACGADFRPEYSDSATDSPRHAGEGIPVVGHVDQQETSYFSDDVPTLL